MYRPMSVAQQRVQIHMVDVDSRERVCAWNANVSTSMPVITKTFDVAVSSTQGTHKKIAYLRQEFYHKRKINK